MKGQPVFWQSDLARQQKRKKLPGFALRRFSLRSSTPVIYCLVDPRLPNIPRYVGYTGNMGLAYRLIGHLSSSKKETSPRAEWVRELLREGKTPLIYPLLRTTTANSSRDEQRAIELLRDMGFPLVNTTGAQKRAKTLANRKARGW